MRRFQDKSRAMPPSPHVVSIEEIPSSTAERRLAAGLCVALVVLAAVTPFLPGQAATAINGPSFLTAYDLLTTLCDTITGFLLLAQFRQTGSPLLVCLAGGYLFTGMMAGVHTLMVPGLLLTGNPLAVTRNASLIVRAFWMAGQPIGAITALLVRRWHASAVQRTDRTSLATLATAALLAGVVVWLATAGNQWMPDLRQGGRLHLFLEPAEHGVRRLHDRVLPAPLRHPGSLRLRRRGDDHGVPGDRHPGSTHHRPAAGGDLALILPLAH
jgi:hypothetical protein